MALNPIRWAVTCDHPAGCGSHEESGDYFAFRTRLQSAGWQLGVKLNGERAQRGGKDYCPTHRRGE
jgi:hypothetical protein